MTHTHVFSVFGSFYPPDCSVVIKPGFQDHYVELYVVFSKRFDDVEHCADFLFHLIRNRRVFASIQAFLDLIP